MFILKKLSDNKDGIERIRGLPPNFWIDGGKLIQMKYSIFNCRNSAWPIYDFPSNIEDGFDHFWISFWKEHLFPVSYDICIKTVWMSHLSGVSTEGWMVCSTTQLTMWKCKIRWMQFNYLSSKFVSIRVSVLDNLNSATVSMGNQALQIEGS